MRWRQEIFRAAIKAAETVESSFTGVMNDWSRALELSRATLEVI